MDIKQTENGTILQIYVKPKSKSFTVKLENNKIVVYCTEPPIKGKANKEIEKKLSKILKTKVKIISGLKSQQKQILIQNLNPEKVKQLLSKIKARKGAQHKP